MHALGVKLNVPKIQLQNNLKQLGLSFIKMKNYKQIMTDFIFEDQKLINKTFQTEFLRKMSRCEKYFMDYSLLEEIGGEEILKNIVEMFHNSMMRENPKCQKLNLNSQQVYKGFLYLIVKEDCLSMTFDYLINLQKQFELTQQDFYHAKKLIQKCFECYGVAEKPLNHVLEIFDSIRHLATEGYGRLSKDQNNLEQIIQELSSDIYLQLTKSKEVEEQSIEDKLAMSQENIQNVVNCLLRPYCHPYYNYLYFPYNKSNRPLQNKNHKKNVQNLIQSRIFPFIASFIQEYFQNSNPQNLTSSQSPSNIQKKISNLLDPLIILDIKIKLQFLINNVKYNLQEDNQHIYNTLVEMSPQFIIHSAEEFLAINEKIKQDLQGNLSEQAFQHIYKSLFKFCLNQFIDDFPLRISAYDIFEMIKEYKLSYKMVEKICKILWKILKFNCLSEIIIEIFYKQYCSIKDFLKACCESQFQKPSRDN